MGSITTAPDFWIKRKSMKFSLIRILVVSAFSWLSAGRAQASGIWNGTWCTIDPVESKIDVIVNDDGVQSLIAGGKTIAITEYEISPDKKTLLFRWEGGEGTLIRLQEGTASLTIFDKKNPIRSKPVIRH